MTFTVRNRADSPAPPLSDGRFDLDHYIDCEMCKTLSKEHDGLGLQSLRVCQASVPLIAAVALMETQDSPHVPASMTLMGGPIDTRRKPTKVTFLRRRAAANGCAQWHLHRSRWLCRVGRDVYPGFPKLTSFLAMNIDRHVNTHFDFFDHLVTGDRDSAAKYREFYEEDRSGAEYFWQTVDIVFVLTCFAERRNETRHAVEPCRHSPRGVAYRGRRNDEIRPNPAGHDLCQTLPQWMKANYL
jgi:poly(3-hydroxybutyrate) depolymerase